MKKKIKRFLRKNEKKVATIPNEELWITVFGMDALLYILISNGQFKWGVPYFVILAGYVVITVGVDLVAH